MNHTICKSLAVAALLCAGFGAQAQDFSDNGIEYSVLPDRAQSVAVAGADSTVTDLIIPATVSYNNVQYDVTAIADNAFMDNMKIRSVTIPNTVQSIGSKAFKHCESLTSVDIPESVATLGESAFYWCTALTSAQLPEGLTEIPSQAFYRCQELTAINIPETVTKIGRSAFTATALTNIDIPEGVTKIGAYAYLMCKKARTLNIPSTVTSIGDNAFSDTQVLREINCAVREPFECWPDFRSYSINNAKVYVPVGTSQAYKAVMPWSMFAHIIEKDFPNTGSTTVCGDIQCDDPAANGTPVQVYTLNGTPAGSSLDNLQPGIYLVRTGDRVQKVVI